MTGWRGDVDEKLEDHEGRIKVVEDQVGFFKDRETGIKLVVSAIVVAIGLIATILAIAKSLGII